MSEVIRTPDGAVREITSERTENAKVFDMGGGRRHISVAQQPVHFFDAVGGLRTLQADFAREPGMYTFRNNQWELEIDDDEPRFRMLLQAGAAVLESRLVSVNGVRVARVTAVVDRQRLRVVWPDVAPGVDQILDFSGINVMFPVYITTVTPGPMEFVWESRTEDITRFPDYTNDNGHRENFLSVVPVGDRGPKDWMRPARVSTVLEVDRVGRNDVHRLTKTWTGEVGVRDARTRIRAWSSDPADIQVPVRIGGV